MSVLDKNGTQVFTGTTGGGGLINDIPVVVTIFSQAGAELTGSADDLGPFQARGTDATGTLTGVQSIPAAAFPPDPTITLTLT